MQIHKILFSLTLAFLVAANCMAQDETKTSNRAKKATERAIKNTTTQMMKAFEKANLTDEQKEKAQEIIAKHVPDVMAARKAQDSLLSDEQKAKRKEAIAKAKEDGAKGAKTAAAGIEAMGLSEEELKEFTAAKKKVTLANAKIKDAIMALLTKEQMVAMPAKKGKKGKKRAGKENPAKVPGKPAEDAGKGEKRAKKNSAKVPGKPADDGGEGEEVKESKGKKSGGKKKAKTAGGDGN